MRLAVLLHAAGQREEALALLARTTAAMEAALPPDETLYLPLLRVHGARMLHHEGRHAEALVLVQQANASRRRHYAGSYVLGAGLCLEGAILGALGMRAQARTLLDEGEAAMRRCADGALRPWRLNRLRLERARLDLAEGRVQDARAQLAQVVAPDAADAAGVEPWPECAERDVLAATVVAAGAQFGAGDAVR